MITKYLKLINNNVFYIIGFMFKNYTTLKQFWASLIGQQISLFIWQYKIKRTNIYIKNLRRITLFYGLLTEFPTIYQKQTIVNLFIDIQPPFDRHRPKNRNNFLSYTYIIYKFCELLGYDDFLYKFPLLKSDNKLRDHDAMWKKICKDMEFQFIPTV